MIKIITGQIRISILIRLQLCLLTMIAYTVLQTHNWLGPRPKFLA